MKKVIAIASAVLLLTLVGCASSEPAAEDVQAQTTPTEATENQVASVIAEYESDWRDVHDGLGDCRFTWVMDDPEETLAMAEGYTCYLNEQTAGTTAGIVVRDLNALTIPASMTDLVERTTTALQPIADADLKSVCGDGSWPSQSDECNDALASNFMSFGILSGVLDAWAPYL